MTTFRLPEKYTQRAPIKVFVKGVTEPHVKPSKEMRRWLRRNNIEHTVMECSATEDYEHPNLGVRSRITRWVEIDIPDELQALQFKLTFGHE